MTLTYFPVEANYDSFPKGGTVNGSVVFTPNLPVGSVALVTGSTPPVGEVSAPTQASIVNGVLQTSPVNTAPPYLRAYTSDLNLTGALQYRAAFTVQVGGQLVPMHDFLFDAQVPRTTTDAAMTSASTTLTSATAAFNSNDVGAVVTVAGAIPTDAVVTIASVTNSTTVVLSSGATASVSGAALSICQKLDLIEVTPPVGITAIGIVAKGDSLSRIRRVGDTIVGTVGGVDIPDVVDISDFLFSPTDAAHTYDTLPTFTVSTYYGGTLGGSDDTTCIQNTINACRDAGGGIVFIPPNAPGARWKYTQLVVGDGVHLRGAGWHSYALDGHNGGTKLQQLTGVNDDSIIFESVVDADPCGISDLSLRGAAGSTAGHAISVRNASNTDVAIQDLTTFERIYGYGFAGSIIKATRGYPIVISDINGLGNGRYTVEIDDRTEVTAANGGATQVLLRNISGDANLGGGSGNSGAVVYLKGINNPYAPAVSIFGVKSEYRLRTTEMNGDNTSWGCFNAVIIENCYCPITITGVNHTGYHPTHKPGNAIQIKGAARPDLMWQSVNVADYPSQTVGTVPVAVYDEVVPRGSDAPHGVWGAHDFAVDAIAAAGGRVLRFDAFTAPVNSILFKAGSTGVPPFMQAESGVDNNVHLGFAGAGTGGAYWYQNSGDMPFLLDGPGANVGINFITKGAGPFLVNGSPVLAAPTEVPIAPALFDSFTAADGTALDAAKWTVTTGGAAAAAITTNGNRARLTTGATGGYSSADKAFAMSTLATSLIDAEILARQTFGAVTVEAYMFYQVRASVTDVTGGNGYALVLDNGNAYLHKFISSVSTILHTSPFSSLGLAAPSNGSIKWIRLRAKGTTVAFKVWDDATAEPLAWTYSTTDSSVTTGGKTGIWIQGGSAAASGINYVDQVHIYAL